LNFGIDLSINLKKSFADIESGSPFLGTKVEIPELADAGWTPASIKPNAQVAARDGTRPPPLFEHNLINRTIRHRRANTTIGRSVINAVKIQ
jgi:hypothetical protein